MREHPFCGGEHLPGSTTPVTSLLAWQQQQGLQVSSYGAVPTKLCPVPGQDWESSHPCSDSASSALPRCAQGRRGHGIAAAPASTPADARG